ncbi:hypothetical protein ACIGEL_00465 [Rossellomorea aquimaris]|uniref:hypothetical protein n=1 Tax=Rossellomorea aquimaris TaxID=189382 RepID=UPI0037C71D24
MYERRTIYRKNLMSLFNSGSGFPNLGTGYGGNPPGVYQGYVPWEGNQGQGGGFGGGPGYYNQGPYGSTAGPQGFPPPGFPQPGYGPPPFGPAGGYGYGINPIGAGLIGLGLGFLGGQIVNSPFKGPHKRYYYYL